MKRFISALFVLVMLAACAEQPTNNDSSASDQKARADKAQRELSIEIQR
jgi:hypothetical protein